MRKINLGNFHGIAILLILLTGSLTAQVATGGAYKLDTAVIGNGGGTATGGTYKVDGTAGQGAAGGNSAGGTYGVGNGFWFAAPLAPTAAGVSVSGRVVTENGAGIRNVRVLLSGGTLTTPRIALTSSFGYFAFDDVESGHTYIISVASKRYGFGQPAQAINVLDNVAEIIFAATWQN